MPLTAQNAAGKAAGNAQNGNERPTSGDPQAARSIAASMPPLPGGASAARSAIAAMPPLPGNAQSARGAMANTMGNAQIGQSSVANKSSGAQTAQGGAANLPGNAQAAQSPAAGMPLLFGETARQNVPAGDAATEQPSQSGNAAIGGANPSGGAANMPPLPNGADGTGARPIAGQNTLGDGSQPAAPKMPELPGKIDSKPAYRVVGVAFKTYIILEVNDTLLLIDQHAAHERLRYEMYCKQLESGTASQQLLTPLIVRLSEREMALIMDNIDLLTDAGYTVEPFGEHDIQVRAVPHVLGKAELKPLFMDMLNSLNRLKAATLDARRAEIMQMACKSAIKGGDALSESEIDALIGEMLETGAPPTCPHGRPVVKQVSRRDLEKLFKRIQ